MFETYLTENSLEPDDIPQTKEPVWILGKKYNAIQGTTYIFFFKPTLSHSRSFVTRIEHNQTGHPVESMVHISEGLRSDWRKRRADVGQGMGLHAAVWPDGAGPSSHLVASRTGLVMGARDQRLDVFKDTAEV